MAIGSNGATAVAFFVAAASIAWSAVFAWTRWLVRPRESALGLPEYERYLERRLASVEQAVQAMSAELERVAEGQRLSAQLLAERLPAAASAPRLAGEPRRVNTPH